MKKKIKVGDRVEVIADSHLGEQGVIIEIDNSKIPYRILFDNGSTGWKYEKKIKLIPTMKNIKDLGEKVAIQCKTPEEWDWVTKELGYKWRGACWYDYKENTGINAGDKGMSRISWYADEGYTIYQASDFMPLSPQDEIKELKARIATLEESLRPKKKIEFVRLLHSENMTTVHVCISPDRYDSIEVLFSYPNYDVMKATHSNTNDSFIYLGHFNDGEK